MQTSSDDNSNIDPAHVLIVDDDDAIRDYFGALLRKQNYRVSTAIDATSALSLVFSDAPDVMVLDQHLPDASGEELLQQLRRDKRTRELPVIFLTSDPARFRAVMDLGADDFITKPAKPAELTNSIVTQIAKYQRRKSRRERHAALAEARAAGIPPGYDVVGTLGNGASATVHRVRKAGRDGELVLKVIKLAPDLSDDALARFTREGELLERIAHPNVVRVHEHGTLDKHAYLAMEYVDGGTLRAAMDAPWEMNKAVRLVAHIARGLAAAHAAGVVHRDLKPENILLRKDSGEPVLLDFGAARDLRGESSVAGAADPDADTGNKVIGTPSYMAPEVIQGRTPVPASDVYGCGVILFELLTGAKPFFGEEPKDTLHQHLRAPVPQLPPHYKSFQPLLELILAKNPAGRPRDGAQLSSALEAFADTPEERPPVQAVPLEPTVTPQEPGVMIPAPKDGSRLVITSRLAELQAAYRGSFDNEFDAEAFRRDDFYAFQVLEKALREGSPELKAIAAPLEETLITMMETEGALDVLEPSAPRGSSYEPPPVPAAAAAIPAAASDAADGRLAAAPLATTATQAALQAAAVTAQTAILATLGMPAGPTATPAAQTDASSLTEQLNILTAEIGELKEEERTETLDALAITVSNPTIGAYAEPTSGTLELTAEMLPGVIDAAALDPHAGGSIAATDAAGVSASSTLQAAPSTERRVLQGGGAGHVRLGNREIVLLSQLRVQYRKTFGVFIDTFEFTGNDLYARTLLAICSQSGNRSLVALAGEFLNPDATPRFHRRKGVADLEIALQ